MFWGSKMWCGNPKIDRPGFCRVRLGVRVGAGMQIPSAKADPTDDFSRAASGCDSRALAKSTFTTHLIICHGHTDSKVLPDVAAIAAEGGGVDRLNPPLGPLPVIAAFSIMRFRAVIHPKLAFSHCSPSEPYRSKIDWAKVEIFFGDEPLACHPSTPQSNYGMAKAALLMLDRLPIPPDQIHRMRGEIDPQAAAKEYGQMLKEKFGDGGLDLVLLGMGDDGHTAKPVSGYRGVARAAASVRRQPRPKTEYVADYADGAVYQSGAMRGNSGRRRGQIGPIDAGFGGPARPG